VGGVLTYRSPIRQKPTGVGSPAEVAQQPMRSPIPDIKSPSENSVPNESRVVCSECGGDGGSYSVTVPHDDPSYCPWCGHPVDGDLTGVVPGDEETTGLSVSEGGNL
jgi:hypothetical protein